MLNHNSPIIKLLDTLGSMMMVSFYWLICCLPIVTIVPASAALYHTSIKVIHGRSVERSVTKDFFKSFAESFKQGWILSLIVIAATFFMIVGIYAGIQIYKLGIFGLAYLALGVVIGVVIYPSVIFIPIVLSRFEGNIKTIIQISAFFASGNILVNIEFAFLLVLMAIAVWLFPLFLLIVPALYADLIRPQSENMIASFIKLQGLEDEETETEEKQQDIISMSEFEASLSSKGKGKRK